MSGVEIGTWITAVAEQGELLAGVIDRTPPDAPVPSCPEWRLRDLVGHTGRVHRWAEAVVRERRTANSPGFRAELLAEDNGPSDEQAADWLRTGVNALVTTLRETPPDADMFTFMAASSPLAFWARRQAHETAIHRVDAELAAGTLTPTEPALATDGIDELITGFVGARGEHMRADRPTSLAVSAGGRHWLIEFTPQGATVRESAEPVDADCTVSGAPCPVYRVLWNRAPWDELTISGDESVVGLWSQQVRIGARR